MFLTEVLFFSLGTTQPLLIGILVTFGLKNYFYSSLFYKSFNSLRNKNNQTKLYECSTNSRLASKIIYNLYMFTLCLTFLVYDVDLIFFFCEMTHACVYGYESYISGFAIFLIVYLTHYMESRLITFNFKF